MKFDKKDLIYWSIIGFFIGLIVGMMIIGIHHLEERAELIQERDNQLAKLLEKVDNASNEVQRIGWQDKTYLIFRYRGFCEPDDTLNIQSNMCLGD